ncbi:MAG: dihydrolipoamide acetyltransferase family protein [Flavobacteriales bacterium]
MSEYHLILPAMGESVAEATIVRWVKSEGDTIKEEDILVEIATDKVDSEVPSPVSGILKKKLFAPSQVAKVGTPIAVLELTGEVVQDEVVKNPAITAQKKTETSRQSLLPNELSKEEPTKNHRGRFYSPLVRSIAQKEGISQTELDRIPGSGKEGRLTKDNLLAHLNPPTSDASSSPLTTPPSAKAVTISSRDERHEIIEMDRMRKIIATHMVDSRRTAAHVTSFVDADVTHIVEWREKLKEHFKQRTGIRLSFMSVFVQAVVKAIQDFPMINISIEGDTIIKKKEIHIGMATTLPNGNLIVPVIKTANAYNLNDLAGIIDDLAKRARSNQLQPDEIQGGTYTITNIGSFGNILGTPIIHQPQVAIMAVGAIQKKPTVIETSEGDLIGIRHKMYLSHSYDHRVVDGALGCGFVKRVAEYLEDFDPNTEICTPPLVNSSAVEEIKKYPSSLSCF